MRDPHSFPSLTGAPRRRSLEVTIPLVHKERNWDVSFGHWFP